MKVEIIRTLSDGTIVLKAVPDKEHPEIQLPVEGKQYTIYFEKIEPDQVPEFNQ